MYSVLVVPLRCVYEYVQEWTDPFWRRVLYLLAALRIERANQRRQRRIVNRLL
jgi:hypothetical protein